MCDKLERDASSYTKITSEFSVAEETMEIKFEYAFTDI